MVSVTLYTRANCKLCEEAEAQLNELQKIIPHKLTVIDIDSEPSFRTAYALEIPVVEAGPFKIKAPFTRQQLQMTLGAAADRRSQLERINDKAFQMNTAGSQAISGSDRFSYWLSSFQSPAGSICWHSVSGPGFQESWVEWPGRSGI